MAMVVKANKDEAAPGGHISTFKAAVFQITVKARLIKRNLPPNPLSPDKQNSYSPVTC
ncbi:MAG: hypothetical protein HRU80_14835 [Ignavibacteriales bacterium]|nr:MAG: hypothetical protein HRU80_14835 [Ignavibacteriales bacterium]